MRAQREWGHIQSLFCVVVLIWQLPRRGRESLLRFCCGVGVCDCSCLSVCALMPLSPLGHVVIDEFAMFCVLSLLYVVVHCGFIVEQ